MPSAESFQRLAPHLVVRSRRGIVGSSRLATRLRDVGRKASEDGQARPVLITGEGGLDKDNLPAGSRWCGSMAPCPESQAHRRI